MPLGWLAVAAAIDENLHGVSDNHRPLSQQQQLTITAFTW
jgi:hypothetical protein